MAETKPSAQSLEAGHELTDLSPKGIGFFGLSLTILLVIVVGGTYVLDRYYSGVQHRAEAPPRARSSGREPPPEPRLSVVPGQDLQTLRAAENSILESYAWIDQNKGVVRIPIDRAIEILAQKGLPARAQSSDEKSFDNNRKGRRND